MVKHESKDTFLSQTPIAGHSLQQGGKGIRVPLDNIRSALVADGYMEDEEVFSQVNVEDDAIVFYVMEVS